MRSKYQVQVKLSTGRLHQFQFSVVRFQSNLQWHAGHIQRSKNSYFVPFFPTETNV